jgi:hypothetical protein
MSIQILLHTIAEKRPKHGQEIWVIEDTPIMGLGYYGLNLTEVEYQWGIFDDTGYTGDSIVYEEGEPHPDIEEEGLHCKLILIDSNGYRLEDNTYWIDPVRLEKKLYRED